MQSGRKKGGKWLSSPLWRVALAAATAAVLVAALAPRAKPTIEPQSQPQQETLSHHSTILRTLSELQSELDRYWLRRAGIPAKWAAAGEPAVVRLRKLLFDATPSRDRRRRFDLQLAEATLALAEYRYHDALDIAQHVQQLPLNTQQLDAAFHVQGDALYGLGEWQQAADSYAQIGSDPPAGRLLLQLKTTFCLEHRLRLDADPPSLDVLATCYEQLAVALGHAGYDEQAFQRFEQCLQLRTQRFEQHSDPSRRADLARIHQQYAAALHQYGQLPMALEHYTRSIELQPVQTQNPMPHDARQLAELLFGRGTVYLAMHRSDAALQDFEKSTSLLQALNCIDDGPETAERLVASLQHQAQALGRLQRFAEACELDSQALVLLELLRQDDLSYEAQMGTCLAHRGDMLQSLGRLPEASADYRRSARLLSAELNCNYSIELEVELATVLKQHGLLLLQMEQPLMGVAALERATKILDMHLRRHPGDDTAQHLAAAKHRLARFYCQPDAPVHDPDTAARYARHACDLTHWSHAELLETLAVAVEAAGDPRSAEQWRRRAERSLAAAKPSP